MLKISDELIKKLPCTTMKELYKKALIGAKYCVEKDDNVNAVAKCNSLYKSIYINSVLAQLLNIIDDNTVFSTGECHSFINAKVKKQLQAMKSKEANIILNDYHTFVDMLNTEIDNEITSQNDMFNRMMKYEKENLTPDKLKEMINSLNTEVADLKANEVDING